MGKIYIDNNDNRKIDEICWIDEEYSEEESIKLENQTISIINSCGAYVIINIEDIHKLVKALNKAKELGWWTDTPEDEF